MQIDIKALGAELASVVASHTRPLHERIKALEARQLEKGEKGDPGRDGVDGKDAPAVDTEAIVQAIQKDVESSLASMVQKAVADHLIANPPAVGKDGRDGVDGKDGESVTMDEVLPAIDRAVEVLFRSANERIEAAIKAIPIPKDGKDGEPGKDGADGLGVAGAMIDREGSLMVTMTNGEVKNLGHVVGKDGRDGVDGKDGIGLDSFELEYLDETHEIRIKASCGGRTKELRYPAGGIRPGGYWREGTKALAGEAWVQDGSLWIAAHDTTSKPDTKSADWIIAARKGRDGERGPKGQDGSPPAPIKLDPKDKS